MKYGQVSVIFVSNFICSPTLKFRSEISSSSLGVCLAFELSVYLHFTHMLNFYAPAGSSSCLVCHAGDDGTMISSPWLFILCFFFRNWNDRSLVSSRDHLSTGDILTFFSWLPEGKKCSQIGDECVEENSTCWKACREISVCCFFPRVDLGVYKGNLASCVIGMADFFLVILPFFLVV
jgi:hypothetical protein